VGGVELSHIAPLEGHRMGYTGWWEGRSEPYRVVGGVETSHLGL
jgi:hypothetical protein